MLKHEIMASIRSAFHKIIAYIYVTVITEKPYIGYFQNVALAITSKVLTIEKGNLVLQHGGTNLHSLT